MELTWSKDVGRVVGKSATHISLRPDRRPPRGDWLLMLPRKASTRRFEPALPQTDTGDQVENTKAIERIMVRNSANAPVTSGEGGPAP